MKTCETSLEVNSLRCDTYDPIRFLSYCKDKLGATSDKDLARKLGCNHIYISKLRHKRIGVSAGFMLLLHDTIGVGFNEIREAAGIPKYTPKGTTNV